MDKIAQFRPLMQPARPYPVRDLQLEPMAVPVTELQSICREAVADHASRQPSLSDKLEQDMRLLGALEYALPELYRAFCQHAQHRDYCGIFDAGRGRCTCPLSSAHQLARSVLHQVVDHGDLLSQQWAREALDAPGTEK